jgi:hypothetical protein
MARIRTIKPDFWTDEKVVAMSPFARLLFIGMWNFVDEAGRGEFSPMRLKMQILPADPIDATELIGEIRSANLITVYDVEGKQYFQVNNFAKHQKTDPRWPSKLPAPTPTPTDSHQLTPNPAPGKGKERGEKEKEEEKEEPSPSSQPIESLPSSQASEEKKPMNGSEGGEALKCAKPPRHGAVSRDKKFVYFRKGTAEFEAYAEDYRQAHDTEPIANEHGGRWFSKLGDGNWLRKAN